MFNRNEFRAQIVRTGKTSKEVAEFLGIDESTFYRKIQDDGRFTRQEIELIAEFLGISDVKAIFFADELA